MQCVKCGGEVWDNRQKKAAGDMKPNAPDFSCKDKQGCGWVQWPPKAKAPPAPPAPIAPLSAPQAPGVDPTRDAAIQELFWDSFDAVLAGIKKRALTDLFHGDQLCSLTATLFIQRSKR